MSPILDNLKTYHQYDQSETYQQLSKFSRHFENGLTDGQSFTLPKNPKEYKDIVIVTSGKDSHIASFSHSLSPFFLTINLSISTGARLPSYANSNSLIICISGDGSTSETKSTDLEIQAKGIESVNIANQSSAYTFGFLFGLISRFDSTHGSTKSFNNIFSICEQTINKIQKEIGQKNNPAKIIASKHTQKAILFFSAGHLSGVSQYASGQVVRQAKTFSQFWDISESKYYIESLFTYPTKVLSEYQVLLLNSDLYPNNIKADVDNLKNIFAQKRINYTEIKPDSHDWFEQIVESVAFFSFFSYYLSITNKVIL